MTLEDTRGSEQSVDASSPYTLPGFFEALGDDILYAAVCEECETRLIPPRPACYACGSRCLFLEEQSHSGEIVSYTAVYRPPSGFESLAPYPIAIVALDSGSRLLGRVDGHIDELSIGQSVTMRVRAPDDAVGNALSYDEEWPIHVFVPES